MPTQILTILVSFLFAALPLQAHEETYSSPVHDSILLAGNFGEPRLNHFHGGIDIKTRGRVGKPIFAIADGYISQITIGLYGFGNAVFVKHADGRTSVYCHLKTFPPYVQYALRRARYKQRKTDGKVIFKPSELPVSRGQLIAISGNTGFSVAPHLHLEIYDESLSHRLDPLQFYKTAVADTVSPQAHFFMACPQQGGTFNSSTQKQTFSFISHTLEHTFTAWGKVGFALWADDYMQGSFNHLGVYKTELFVDGKLIFATMVDSIPMTGNPLVNFWGDVAHLRRSGVWYLRQFASPTLNLPFAQWNDSRGVVDFSEERTYYIIYRLTDALGNQSHYAFTVEGKPSAASRTSKSTSSSLREGIRGRSSSSLTPRHTLFRHCDYRFETLYGSVPETIPFQIKVKERQGALSKECVFESSPILFMRQNTLSLRLKAPVTDPKKLYLVCLKNKEKPIVGTYKNGYYTAHITQSGCSYWVEADTEAPTISLLGGSANPSAAPLLFRIADEQSGLQHVEAWVGQQYLLLEKQDNLPLYRLNLRESPLRATHQQRTLRIVATDQCGNKRTFTISVTY